MPTSSSATGSALGVVGLLYIVRAGTDVSNVDLSMINPMGWTYLTYLFTDNNWITLIIALIFSVIVVIIAFILEGKVLKSVQTCALPIFMPTSSSATGSALGVVGLLYIVRAGTDVSNVDLSMINPMGWTYLTYPFTDNNWIPLIIALIFSVIVVIIAFILEGNRDMGAGYLPQREGRANAKKSLLSVRGLLVKINKGTI